MKVRQAVSDDAGTIAELIKQLGYSLVPDEARSRLQAVVTSGQEVYVAEIEGKVVGLISYAWMPQLHYAAVVGRITELVVDEKLRGRRIGKSLVAFIEKRAL